MEKMFVYSNQLNSAFTSQMSELMPCVDVWIYQMQGAFEYQIDRWRVIENSVGYILNRRENTSTEFRFEIATFNL